MLKLIELNSAGAVASTKDSESAFALARNAMIAMLVLGVAMTALLALWLIRSITAPLNRAVAATDKMAGGDLTGRIESNSTDETGQLLQALQRMQANFVRIVGSVREGSESVSTASAEIASGNHDLSARTEQQASSLEETAASMEELNSTVKQNADSARQANQLATSASTVAIQGGDVVAQVVDTMKGINESSARSRTSSA